MNIKYFQLITIALLVASLLFGAIPIGYAQSAETWSDPINLSNSGAATSPQLIIDSSGVFHAIWIDKLDGYTYTESKDGLSWTSPRAVRFPFSLINHPPIFVVDSAGLIHIFWQDDKYVLYYGQATPENFDIPSAWRVTTLAVGVLDFDAVIDSHGILHLAYLKNVGTELDPPGIYYRRSGDHGFTWPLASKKLYASLYFRSLTLETAHVRIAAADGASGGGVYVVWDDRNQKLVFMAKSVDAGLSWGEITQISGPEADTSYNTPFNIEISAIDNEVLLMWQVGEPGLRCVQYSQWSVDGANHWAGPSKMFNEFSNCPERSEFVRQDKDFFVALLSVQGDSSLIAWNGVEWSNPQIQQGLSTFLNPVTFETILFQCQQVSFYGDKVFLVGCDETGGDIWFTSRPSTSMDSWFPPPSAWSSPTVVTTIPQKISSLTSVADNKNNIHAVWIQSSLSEELDSQPNIYYARWNGEQWSIPASILTGLSGSPSQLSVKIDGLGRLLLVWVDEQSGDLLFSWADSDRANVTTEWSQPVTLRSPSELNSSPDMLVDASGRIVIVFAVTINEDRGIYFVQSTDAGETWSLPIQVFNAPAAGWEMVDQPRISLSGDGRLHLLFNQYSVQGEMQSLGLYYSQSANGGMTWSEPEAVSTKSIQWSEIIGSDQQTVHRLWQERDKSVFAAFHQISEDGGLTWNSPVQISSISGKMAKVASVMDWMGNLYFVQFASQDQSSLQDWIWNGSGWTSQEAKELINIKPDDLASLINAGVTSKGYLSVLMSTGPAGTSGELDNELLNLSRSVGLSETGQILSSAVISTPGTLTVPTIPDVQPTSTRAVSLDDMNDSSSLVVKALVGLFLLGAVVLVLIVVFVRPNSNKPHDKKEK